MALKSEVGRASTMGDRKHMEDVTTSSLFPDGYKFFAVYDGHGGFKCAVHASVRLPDRILRSTKFPGDIPGAIVDGVRAVESEWNVDSKSDNSGTCFAVAILAPGRVLYVGHVGDCRVVLGARDGKMLRLTEDHRPSEPEERKRVESFPGVHVGKLYRDRHFLCFKWRAESGPLRTFPGGLAITRAVGDKAVKRHNRGITWAPTTMSVVLRTDVDAYLVLATDGVWDNVSECAEMADAAMLGTTPKECAENILAYSLRNKKRGAEQDNASVLFAWIV